MYCLWPLQCTLFVATPTNMEYTCTVCGHYSVLCLWPLLQIGSTHVLFVATTVYSFCGHSYEQGVHMYCLWPLQCTLFVATRANREYTCTLCGHYSVLCLWPLLRIGSSHVYCLWEYMYTVCGHYSVLCLWPLLRIRSTHVYCLWPLQCTLFVATPTNRENTCTVRGHYSLLCLWPLLLIESTHVLFVATTVYSVCGHSYE